MGDKARFKLEVPDAADAARIKGQTLTLTMVSAKGASQTTWVVH